MNNHFNHIFVNTKVPEDSHTFPTFKQGCEFLGLPYHLLKAAGKFPRKYKDWIILKKNSHKAKYERKKKEGV